MKKRLALSKTFLWTVIIHLTFIVISSGAYCSERGVKSSKFITHIELPKTNIKAGILEINEHGFKVGKIGFVINNDIYYLEKAVPEKYDELDVFNGNRYALFKDMLLTGAWSSPTGHGRWLFIFKYREDSIELVDVLRHGTIKHLGYDFIEDYGPNTKDDEIALLSDKKLIKLNFFDINIELFLKVSESGFKIDLAPKLYKQLFYRLKKKHLDDSEIYQYIIYGYISKEMNMEEIKSYLRKKKQDHSRVIELIDNLENLDEILHTTEKFSLIKIEK
jgi:hypothetical protein